MKNVTRNIVTKIGFIDFSSFDNESKHLVERRSGVQFSNDDQICLHHEKVYLTRYQSLQTSCANPISNHKKPVSSKYLSVLISIHTILISIFCYL